MHRTQGNCPVDRQIDRCAYRHTIPRPSQCSAKGQGGRQYAVQTVATAAQTRCEGEIIMSPIVSVVVCTRNRAECLRRCLDHLADQTAGSREFEVIVVDNVSTDATKNVCDSFATRLGIRYVLECELGIGHARNAGLRAAQGRFVAYVDDDVNIEQNWATEIIRIASEIQNLDGMGGPQRPYFTSRPPSWFKEKYACKMVKEGPCFLEPGQVFTTTNAAVRRDVLVSLGGFDTNLGPVTGRTRFGEDTDLFLRLWQTNPGARLYYSPRLAVRHLMHPDRLPVSAIFKRLFAIGIADSVLACARRGDHTPSRAFGVCMDISKTLLKALSRLPEYEKSGHWVMEELLSLPVLLGRLCGLLRIGVEDYRDYIRSTR